MCTSPHLQRVIMHEFTHYAGCALRRDTPASEALAQEGENTCIGTVQQSLDAARRGHEHDAVQPERP